MHSAEVVGRHSIVFGVRCFLVCRVRVSGNHQVAALDGVAEWNHGGKTGRLNSGQSARTVQHRSIKRPALWFRIADLVRVERQIEDMLGREPQVTALNAAKTAYKQSSNNQQRQRPTNLDGNQNVAQTLASTGRTAPAFVQHLSQVAVPDTGRRHDNHERSSCRRDCEGIRENVPVKLEVKDDRQLTLQRAQSSSTRAPPNPSTLPHHS